MPDFPLFNKCNNRCLMCTNPHLYNQRDAEFTLTRLKERIRRFHSGQDEFLSNYRDTFTITGGEPTLSKNLVPVINEINSYFPGIRIVLLSNGRMFYYEPFTKKLLGLAANLEFTIAVHGPNAAVHDAITMVPGSFKETIDGLRNIFRFRQARHKVEIRVVIHKRNCAHLVAITRLIRKEFPAVDRVTYIFYEIEGLAVDNHQTLKLRYTEVAPYLKGLAPLLPKFKEARLYHFPLCVVPVALFPYVWRTLPAHEVCFISRCEKCPLKQHCLGIHKHYPEFMGTKEFKPYKGSAEFVLGTSWYHPIEAVKHP